MPSTADSLRDQSTVKIVSLLVLSVVMVIFILMFYQVMAPYLMSLLLAGVLAILAQPMHSSSLAYCRGWTSLAAAATTTGVVVVIVLPILFAILLTGLELSVFVQDNLSDSSWEQIKSTVSLRIDQFVQRIMPLMPAGADQEAVKEQLLSGIQNQVKQLGVGASEIASSTWGIIGTLINFFIQLTVCLLGLYFFLADGPRILHGAQNLIPIQPEYQQQVFDQFTKVTRSVVMGTLVAAVGQGIAMSLAVGFLGIGHIFVIGMVTTVAAMVPMIGAAGVYVPMSIYLATQGHYFTAAGLFLFGFLVISSIDNVVRAYTLSSNVQMHPLLGFVSILGGLEAFGLWGIFLGPMIASVLYALAKIFNQELKGFMATSSPARGESAGEKPGANFVSDVTATIIATPVSVVATIVDAAPPAPEVPKPPAC
ncbi:putative inner membrane protein [Planctopirus ephydatiae]|jgi:predicted PurR-regulated permease PerM|uniref:Putative inner membrane protein n=1 Tax=Planctopirus ephydatiae TaxID=2528019 RepID=A0A518GKK0_9PLAN|nr:AI-2E family transporter [Planctopirus ephydatiae]QDV29165.1 putative inner membrane protein [Planctopirus ephydatiae]